MSNECSTIVWKRDFGNSNRKVIAARLADHADDEGRGIWPSVERIAAQCNVSDRTVQRTLAAFVEEGILMIVSEGGKGPGSTTRYDFDMRMVEALPLAWEPRTQQNKGDTVSPLGKSKGDTTSAKGDNPDEKGCHGVTQTVIEPPIEPSSEEREAREADEEKPEGQSKRAEALFYRSFTVWDRFAVSPKPPMLDAWGKLTWSQMQAAADAVPRYLAACRTAGVKHAPAISTFLDVAEKMWEAFPPEPEKPQPPYAPAFGPIWAAIRMRDLVTGPKVAPSPLKGWEERAVAEGRLDREALEKGNLMRSGWPIVNALHMAAETRGLGIHDFGPEEAELGKLCEFVPVGSAVWEAWKAEHERRGWPWLPDPGSMRGVYFPVGGPDGLEAFEMAVRGNHDAGGREAAE